jgi:AAA+ superfamily predicted ATPase
MSDISFIPTNPIHDFSQIILSQEIKDEIFDALNVINFQSLIYHDWGFEEVDPIPKSVLNFYGPPGTGKTMCAHAIAKKMGKKLLALNYAEIESKYVGEAPKNLMKAFETAKQNDCILFFDEADSFLGKRIQNVTHGSEQALNSLRSQMLILLEEFNGIVLFATNLVTNFDKAFESRILKHIKFELPNQEARCEIINKMLPQKLPLQHKFTDDEFTELSKVCEGFSGREIKGAILETLLNKASTEQENAVFTFDDFNKSFLKKAESKKQQTIKRRR